MNGKKELVIIPAAVKAENKKAYNQKRVAAYCRVSTDSEEQLTSYENQLSYYTEKIMKNPQWSMVGIFADEGITGTQTKNRAEFNKMIKMCQQGKIDLILTKSISRFARNTVDCLNFVRALKAIDVAVMFEKENINTLSMESETLISLLATLAQAESESISGNVKWGVRKGFKQGKALIHYNNLLGYEKGEDGNPKVVPEEAEVVRFIFNSYLAGSSLSGIKSDLEQSGVITSRGKEAWSITPIQHILRNEKYVGDVLMQKTYTTDCISKKVRKNNGELPKYLVKNNHEAIIDRITFNRVQKEIARRVSKRKVSGKAKTQVAKYSSKYALSELLVCGKCGSHYKRVTWSGNGKKKIVWRCISRLDYGKKYCPDSPTMEEEVLHKTILKAINDKLDNKGYLMDVLKGNLQIALNNGQEQEENPFILDSQINEHELQLKQLVKLAASSDTEKRSGYYIEIASIGKRIEELKAKKKEITIDAYNGDDTEAVCDAIGNVSNAISEFDDKMIRQIVDVVRVVDKERIEVVFKGGDEVRSEGVISEVL